MKKSNFMWSFLLAVMFINPVTLYGGDVMQLESTAYADKGQIPVKHCMPGAGGQNVSVPATWSNPPQGTKSFALSMIDPHPVANNWIHWLVIDIPPETLSLEQGASGSDMPQGSRELANSFGRIGYGGPQPPRGTGEHPYVLTLYALNTESLDLAEQSGLSDFEKAVEGRVLGKAEYTGFFEQK